MQMKTLPTTELRNLLAAVSSQGKQHLVEVEQDLQQTTYLLNEAIEKLGAGFMAVHEAVMQQQKLIDDLLQKQQVDSAETKLIQSYKQKIGDEVNAVVTGLQFQDMTNQLLTRTIKRVTGLKDLLQELANHGDEMEPQHEHEEIARFLDAMNLNFNTRSHALSGGLRQSVDQRNLTAGDIDLF
jgi:hypothetical protein